MSRSEDLGNGWLAQEKFSENSFGAFRAGVFQRVLVAAVRCASQQLKPDGGAPSARKSRGDAEDSCAGEAFPVR